MILAAALALMAVAAFVAGYVTERSAGATLAAGAAADARLRQALLVSEVERFRILPVAVADDRDLVSALAGEPGAIPRLNTKLAMLAARTGAAVIYVIDGKGRAIASSNARTAQSFVGQDYRFRRYYADAMRTGVAEQFARGTVSRRPGLYLARRVNGGVIVIKLDFTAIEQQWRAAGGITFVTDAAGVILVTSRPDWRFVATRPLRPDAARRELREAGVARLIPSPLRPRGDGRVTVAGERGRMLLSTTRPDNLGWRVNLVLPTGLPVDTPVRIVQAAAALLAAALIAAAAMLRRRGRQRAERTLALETAVAERTADLSREISERAAAEARAADLREGLRQANRLAALGQITASVAHETAQPVAAIRTYAANSERLLDRGEDGMVRDNLKAIARLTERIGTVTTELRTFSRKGSGPVRAVAIADVIDGAGLILKERLSRVTLDLPDVPPGLSVLGGRVRLEQVLVNLLQNAIEALDGRPDPRIIVSLRIIDAEVRLTVADNGPGIAPDIAERMFTPFATSRPNGLGLGLVIAQDIMADLGGSLRLVPAAIGARFEMTCRRMPA